MDLRQVTAATEEEAIRIAIVDVSVEFAVFGGDVTRTLLISAGNRHLLVITIHHVACDGISIALIMGELRRLYMEAPN